MKRELAPRTAELIASAGEAAEFLKKFAHPSRLMIVCAPVDGERSVRDRLASQPSFSCSGKGA